MRLMKRYEEQLQKDETEDKIQVKIELESAGEGCLRVKYTNVLDFSSVDTLFQFLEGNELKRSLMIRG